MERKRIIFLVLLWVVLILRVVLTVLTLTGVLKAFPFTMFSVPFLLASAYVSARLSVGLLLGYLIVFLFSALLLLFRKTRAAGVLCFAATVLADTCAMILSAVLGSNQYFWLGIPFCVLVLLVCALCFHALRHRTEPAIS